MLDSSPSFRFMELDEVVSTNTFLSGYHPLQTAEITLVSAEYQSAGRGQQGNSWESDRGQNLLFSLLLHPTFLPPTHLFLLSEAIALSIRQALCQFLAPSPSSSYEVQPTALPEVTVKWPNDIYVGDRKIAGILIENELRGQHIGRCIIGCGININQPAFHSDAPNPVSLRQLVGKETTRSLVLDAIITHFRRHYTALRNHFSTALPPSTASPTALPPSTASLTAEALPLHRSYLTSLYRRTGFHPYLETASATPFSAEIADVEPGGNLLLRDTTGRLRRYAFKEVSFILPPQP